MKTIISMSAAAEQTTLSAGRLNLAQDIIKPLGLTQDSPAHQMMTGAIAYLLERNSESKTLVAQLRSAVKQNHLVLDKALDETTSALEL